ESGNFEGVQSFARIAVGQFGEVAQGCFVRLDFHVAEPAFLIGQRALQEVVKLRFRKRAQLEDLRAGNERGIDEEKGIVSGGTDKADHAAFHVREQNVLLSLVEAMDFIDEKNG